MLIALLLDRIFTLMGQYSLKISEHNRIVCLQAIRSSFVHCFHRVLLFPTFHSLLPSLRNYFHLWCTASLFILLFPSCTTILPTLNSLLSFYTYFHPVSILYFCFNFELAVSILYFCFHFCTHCFPLVLLTLHLLLLTLTSTSIFVLAISFLYFYFSLHCFYFFISSTFTFPSLIFLAQLM